MKVHKCPDCGARQARLRPDGTVGKHRDVCGYPCGTEGVTPVVAEASPPKEPGRGGMVFLNSYGGRGKKRRKRA